MKLSELKTGESAVIIKIRGYGEFRHRITEMGFVRGKEVRVVCEGPDADAALTAIGELIAQRFHEQE